MNERDSSVLRVSADATTLLDLTACAQANYEETIDEESHSADDGDCSSGAGEIHAGGVWWPVVALLRVAPVLQDDNGTRGEKKGSDEIQDRSHFPRNTRENKFN